MRVSSSRLVSILAILFCCSLVAVSQGPVAAQDHSVTFQVSVPAETPEGDPVYIAGDFQGWNPGDPGYQLSLVGELLYEITLVFNAGSSLEFKFTRGDWSKVEKGLSGEEIGNRTLTVTATTTVQLSVASWADRGSTGTITGDVRELVVPGFLSGRRVWIYLPPDYDALPTERFPVLYMLDGQNVFDVATSFAGEWQVDESCERLIAAGEMRPIIVVAVANGEMQRLNEYTPWFDPDFQGGVGGGGEAHLQEFIDVLLPFVDTNYRTRIGPQNTGFSGSSLGGLMSVYAAYSHPETFGLIGAVSSYIAWKDHELLSWVMAQSRPESKIYMDMGTRESGTMVDEDQNGTDDSIDDLRALRDILLGHGFVIDDDLMVVEDEGANHNEAFWAARFPETLKYLFPRVSVPSETGTMGRIKSGFGDSH